MTINRFNESDSAWPRHTARCSPPRGSAPLQVEHGAARVEHAEVVDVDPALAEQPRGHLLDDAQSERLEDRHEGGQIHLAAGLVELDARQPLSGRLVAQTDDEAFLVRLELLQPEDVVDDQGPVVVRL